MKKCKFYYILLVFTYKRVIAEPAEYCWNADILTWVVITITIIIVIIR